MWKSVAFFVAAAALPVLDASAAIRCDGPFQIINGNKHVTPWCQDNYLAAVAREYGMRVSASAIRNNPSTKERACRFVGADIRVKDTCHGYRPDRGGNFRF